MRRDDEIIIFDDKIMYRRNGQVELKRLPGVAVVNREVNAELRPRKEQAFLYAIFTNGSHVCAVGDTVVDSGPGLAKITRAIDVGADIVESMAVDRGIGDAGVEV